MWHIFTVLYLVILFPMLPSNLIVSGVKSPKTFSVLILNVYLFSILFTYILIERLSIFSLFFVKYIQNSLAYLIWNKIH